MNIEDIELTRKDMQLIKFIIENNECELIDDATNNRNVQKLLDLEVIESFYSENFTLKSGNRHIIAFPNSLRLTDKGEMLLLRKKRLERQFKIPLIIDGVLAVTAIIISIIALVFSTS